MWLLFALIEMSSLTFKQDTYILNNVKNILKIPHRDSNRGGKRGGGAGNLCFMRWMVLFTEMCSVPKQDVWSIHAVLVLSH